MDISILKHFTSLGTRGRVGNGRTKTQCGGAVLGNASLNFTIEGFVGYIVKGQQRWRRYAWPKYTKSTAQETYRNKFTAAKAAWALLSEEAKAAYEARRKKKKWGMYAENLFEREFLLS